MARHFLIYLVFSLSVSAVADGSDELFSRMQSLNVSRQSLYPNPLRDGFSGYTLFADPYDVDREQINFLLGTDCSHFVHRLMQLLGFEYPFMKTAHFIDFAQGDLHLLTEEQRRVASLRWEVIDENDLKPGDIIVTGKFRPLENIERGHMGIVTSIYPTKAFQSAIRKGIVDEIYGPRRGETAYYFRYKGPIRSITANHVRDLLAQKYPRSPKFCEMTFKP